MIVQKTLEEIMQQPLTEEQIQRAEKLEAMSDDDIVIDEDCPDITDEQIERFKRTSSMPRCEIILSEQTAEKVKALGENRMVILSRIIEDTLMDSQKLEKYIS